VFGHLIGLAVFVALLALTHGLLDLFQLVAKLAQALRDGGFRHNGVAAHAAPDPIGIALHITGNFRLLHLA